MVDIDEGGRQPAERANRLYWSSEESVNEIADVLGLSKGRLYALVRPLAAGRYCPECNTEMVYENRTARERDEATCPACAEGNARGSRGDLPETFRPEAGAARAPAPGDNAQLLVGLLVGAAAGILLTRWFKR